MEMTVVAKDRPDRSLAAICLLAALSLVGTIALLPSTEEKAAALIADKKYDQAITMLTDLDQGKGLNSYEAFMLAQLYTLSGQKDAAVHFLERQLAAAPDSTWALQQLADLYRSERQFPEEALALRQLYALDPQPERFDRLRELYRLLGDVRGEQELLTQAVAAGHASETDVKRLDYLRSGGTSSGQSFLWTDNSGRFAAIWRQQASEQFVADSGHVVPVTLSID